MSSVYVICWIFLQTFQTFFCIQTNMWTLISLILVHTVCKNDLKSQADDKAEDNCCDWQFKG